MVSHYTDYPYRRRRRPFASRYQASRYYPSKKKRRYAKQKYEWQMRYRPTMEQLANTPILAGMTRGGSYIGGELVFGPWTPAIA